MFGSDGFDVDGFWPFAAFANFELDFLTINQGFAAAADDVGEVNEEVFVAVAANEPKALLIVEELHGAFWHIGVLTFVGLGSLATKIKVRLTAPELTRHLQLKVSGSKLFLFACEYLRMSEPILLDEPRPGITCITLNRPDDMNTLTVELVNALHDALTTVHNDHSCRVVVLTGAGRAFCAGLDLKGYGTIPGTESFGGPQQGMAVQQHIAEVVHHMRAIRQPIVAAINGAAAGGGFAWACASDIRYCSDNAKFGTAFIRLGISGCDIGVSWTLPRLIGVSRAWELIYTGRVIDAAEAERLGIVSRSVPADELMETALGVAEEIARNSPFGVWMTKEVLWSNLETTSMRAGIDIENRNQILAAQTDDSKAAMSGFLSGNIPEWKNR